MTQTESVLQDPAQIQFPKHKQGQSTAETTTHHNLWSTPSLKVLHWWDWAKARLLQIYRFSSVLHWRHSPVAVKMALEETLRAWMHVYTHAIQVCHTYEYMCKCTWLCLKQLVVCPLFEWILKCNQHIVFKMSCLGLQNGHRSFWQSCCPQPFPLDQPWLC